MLAPLADTFRLHSRPGAGRIIYLDFDGDMLAGGAWNSYTGQELIPCPAWDIDGSVAVFGDAERIAIQHVWQRVAEDYEPFDVDVTTEVPPADRITRASESDDVYGTRVLISPVASFFGEYGGIAYVGVYNRVDAGDYYKPALVFPEKLGNNDKNIAEAASHEVGHNLGLSHDGVTGGDAYYAGQGDGETGWAPIMGVGYDRNLSQWSRGEYANADNPEDDLAVIQSYGLGYRADDHGDSLAAATALPAGSALAVSGSITQAADTDVFGFTAAAGAARFSVRPAEHGPDLDLQIAVLTADGSILAISEPPDTLGADISLSLGTAGAYYLRVQGVGKGDPRTTGYTDYASLGQYAITGTVVDPGTTPRPPVAVASATPNTGAAPLAVAFTAAGSFDLDGSIVAYAWDFGDGGSAAGAAVTHTYSAAGSFTATLTVTDDSGRTGAADVTVRVVPRPPVAVASATPTSGDAPLPVAFTAAGSSDLDGSIVAYAWDFGDGTSATGAAVTHTYPAGGAYTATLTVTDNDGLTGSAALTISARAFNQFPAAVASATPSTGVAPLVVTFTAAGSSDLDGSIVAYAWDFGDGTGATGASATHTYLTGGSFTATLTVTDERGGTGRSSMIVCVTIGSRASLTAPATSAYASATLSGSLRTVSGALLAGRPMVIQSSSDAAHWTTVKTITTGAGGTFKTKVTPTRRTLYRAHFSGDDAHAPSSSAMRVVKPRVRLTTPDAPSNAQRGRSFTVSGYLEPRHIAGTSAVMLDCYRYRSGAWTLRKTVVAVASNYRTYTRYRASVSLQSVGSWRIRARHAADGWNAATWSGERRVTVR